MLRNRLFGSGGQRGQAMAEMGIVLLFLLTLLFGIIEYGRMFMVANMITHGARDGARAAAVEPPSNRDNNGMITNTSGIETLVREQIDQVLGDGAGDQFGVAVTQPTVGGENMVRVQVTGSVPNLFGTFVYLTEDLIVDRSVTFRDEGR